MQADQINIVSAPAATSVITALIVDDHAAARSVLRDYLAAVFPDWTVLEADAAEPGLDLCATAAPQLVLMDVSLPGKNGIEATREIVTRYRDTMVVVISIHDTPIYRDQARAAGALGFVTKSRLSADLAPLLRQILAS